MTIKAEHLLKFNKSMTALWILLIIPTLLFWKESVLWVALMSLWANIVGHFSAYVAGRGEIAQQQGYNLTDADKRWIQQHVKLATQPLREDGTVEIKCWSTGFPEV